MTPERWQRIQEVFGEAVELPAGPRREAFLDRACAGDAELRARIAEMLALDEDASSVLDATPLDLAEAVRPVEPPGSVQPFVGPYRILKEIGRGGMGAVYLAEREDVGKRVALKLVRGGLAAPDHLERFLREQRVLARLEHPNIAPLLDAGVTAEDTPFLAMELVEGQPLDTFCDTRRLSLPERLALFIQVCEAVQYAHRNLVVHRDLKPSNIMVTEQGAVKLLDFGIAKLLVGEEDGGAGITRTGARLLTPEYAAPEQVLGEPVTTAADVYALGVVLYELLTGCRPHTATGRRWGEIEAEVLTAVPTRPSIAATRPRELVCTDGTIRRITPEEISAARGTTPASLRRALRGDLDTVVLKALEKEPAHRYASAQQLLDDLERHLKGLPILARPATRRYRTRKFVGRHRTAIGAAAALLVLVAGTATVVGFEQAGAARERERARLEAEKAEQSAEFLGQLFATSDPRQARGRLISTPALLEWGERNAGALHRQPEIQAQVLSRIGEAYIGLGMYQRAAPLLERSLALRLVRHPGDHPDVAESLWWVGVIRTEQADFGEAERLIRESLAMRRRLFGNEHPHVVEGLNGLGFMLVNRGDLHHAEQVFREALAIEMHAAGAQPMSIPGPRNGIAFSLIEQGRYADAEPFAREALAAVRAAEGGDHPFHMIALAHLARVLHGGGKLAEAETLFREAVENTHRIQGETHPRLATYLTWYANLLAESGELAGAETAYRRALGIQRHALAPAHFFLVPTLTGLGQLLNDTHRPREAEPLLREAVAIAEQRLPLVHHDLARARSELGACLVALGRTEEAELLLDAGHTALREALGDEHPLTRRARGRLEGLRAR